ncbi:exodeoxyribonuclease VII large subunit [Marinibactrum halimedae]
MTYYTSNSPLSPSSSETSTTPQRKIFSVSQLNRTAKLLLEQQLPLMWVQGEISNMSVPSSGHWYFTLKDSNAQIRCAMFRNRNQSVRFRPKHGQEVLIRGRVSLYEGRGDFQLIVEHMEEAGLGDLQQQFEQLKQKLSDEGLFDPARKQALPSLPLHVGVITSPTGAAIRDVLSVFQRRFPAIPITVIPALVQGNEAAHSLVNALHMAIMSGLFDVLIIGRGGGSLEDLWPFNEEIVARAIAECPIPIVSAVGHEVDFTIADFVADYRAPTPSAAAEVLSPDQHTLSQRLLTIQQKFMQSMLVSINQRKQATTHLRKRLKHPRDQLRQQAQRVDHLEIRLQQILNTRLSQRGQYLRYQANRLLQQHPRKQLPAQHDQLNQATQRLFRLSERLHQTFQTKLAALTHRLDSVSPLNTLKRGYSIVTDQQGAPIVDVNKTSVGDQLSAKLANGTLEIEVMKISPLK